MSNHPDIAYRRAALFVDFENIHIGLTTSSAEAGHRFATQPGLWVDWLENSLGPLMIDAEEQPRKLLRRICYLDPARSGKYRVYFTRAGFRVVDCPSLTSMGKNSADIHMVLDILDTLTHPVYYDEFIVLSADADFTPVLQRLREHDRRSAILTANPAAAAMHAACDFAIPDVIFLDEALGLGEPEAEPEAATIKQPDHDSPDDALHTKIQSIVRDLVAESKSPIAMAKAAHEVRKVAGSAVDTTAWAGSGSFGKFVAGIVDEHLQVAIGRSPGWLFDPTRHTPPEVEASAVDVPEVARRINHVVRAPLLPTSAYTCLFDVLAGDARSMAGSGQVAVERAARDICAERGETVSRQAVHFVLVNYSYNGISWTTPEWDANVLASQFADSMLKLAADAQMALTDDEQAEVRQWIQGGQGGAQI